MTSEDLGAEHEQLRRFDLFSEIQGLLLKSLLRGWIGECSLTMDLGRMAVLGMVEWVLTMEVIGICMGTEVGISKSSVRVEGLSTLEEM